MFNELQIGDIVDRFIGDFNGPKMQLVVTDINKEEGLIICGAWTFSMRNGAEIDEDLGWNENTTGSFIVLHRGFLV